MSTSLSSPVVAEAPAPGAAIEVNDAVFCTHAKEVCVECDFDGREENDTFFGLDPKERGSLELPPYIITKTGAYQCKKHANPSCNQCYGWKKQIMRLQREAKKGKK